MLHFSNSKPESPKVEGCYLLVLIYCFAIKKTAIESNFEHNLSVVKL